MDRASLAFALKGNDVMWGSLEVHLLNEQVRTGSPCTKHRDGLVCFHYVQVPSVPSSSLWDLDPWDLVASGGNFCPVLESGPIQM